MSDEKKCENPNYEKHRFELLLSFHTQFAENQNHHHNVLFKLLYLFGVVIVGYGYILHGYPEKYDEMEAMVASIAAQFLLCIGLATTCNMAYGFRRDQLVNYKIRKKYGIIAEKETDDNIFPFSYNPIHTYFSADGLKKNKIGYLNWMPEFYKIFSLVFLAFLFLVIIAFQYRTGGFSIYRLLASLVLLLNVCSISFSILGLFQKKVSKIYKNEARLLQKK